MSLNALKAAFEGLDSTPVGAIQAQANDAPIILPVENVPSQDADIEMKYNREETVQRMQAQLEDQYQQTGEVGALAEELNEHIESDRIEQQEMKSEIHDLQARLSGVHSSLEMLSRLKSMDSIDAVSLQMANGVLRSHGAPSLESIDGMLAPQSVNDLSSYLQANVSKLGGWFKDLFDRMKVNGLRSQRTLGNFEARIKRMQSLLDKLPEDLGQPMGQIAYNPRNLLGLYAADKPLEFTEAALAGAIKKASELTHCGLKDNSTERLAIVKVITDDMPGILMSISDDGGEKVTKAMVEKLKMPEALEKVLTYGTEQPGGLTFLEPNYKPSIRIASWAQPMVEMIEKNRVRFQMRRNGRVVPTLMTPEVIDGVLEASIEHINMVLSNYDNFWGGLVEAYQEAVKSYNKTLALAGTTDHSQLTSEVWKAVDVASYVMMRSFDAILNELTTVHYPALVLIDSALYVCEEQLIRYVKVNR